MLNKAKAYGFWNKVRTNQEYKLLLDKVHNNYGSMCGKANMAHKFSDFIKFERNGTRKEYEKGYFLLRDKLHTLLLLALIYPNDEKYITELQDVIWSICDEFTWIVPAHADNERTVDGLVKSIDLFAALTGTSFSIVKELIGERIDPLIRERMESEIEERIITTFIDKSFWWENAKNNWAAVCGGNTAITFMTYAPEKYWEQKHRFDRIAENYIGGYGDDGICTEGITYWNFGFGSFVLYAQCLLEFTDGKENLFKLDKVKQIAKFCEAATLKNTTISFSDGTACGHYSVAILHLLKEIYKDDIKLPPQEHVDIYGSTRASAYLVYAFVYFNPEFCTESDERYDNSYYPDAQWFVKRAKNYVFAAKAGHNNEFHNHNDVGCFILENDSKQVITDLGAGLYTKEYFHGNMYDIFCKSSLGHSVPIINGKVQGAGEEFCGKMRIDGDKVKIRMEKAYPADELDSMERSFEFSKDRIIMCDTFVFKNDNNEVIERIISKICPKAEKNCIRIGNVRMVSENKSEIAVKKHINHKNQEETVYCIDYKVQNSDKFVLNIDII